MTQVYLENLKAAFKDAAAGSKFEVVIDNNRRVICQVVGKPDVESQQGESQANCHEPEDNYLDIY